jgi:hypothetical protein
VNICGKKICLFEIWFPSKFFDMMTHLIIHLVDEIKICGLVGAGGATQWRDIYKSQKNMLRIGLGQKFAWHLVTCMMKL